jgi:hypothetical protein
MISVILGSAYSCLVSGIISDTIWTRTGRLVQFRVRDGTSCERMMEYRNKDASVGINCDYKLCWGKGREIER